MKSYQKFLLMTVVLIFILKPIITKSQNDIVSMDYHTGKANINLPLGAITNGSIAIPISLNYKTGGIKVRNQASNVGLGWHLFAGGQLTQIVRGMPDDEFKSGPVDGYYQRGWLQTHDLLDNNIDFCCQLPEYWETLNQTQKEDWLTNISSSVANIDTECDIYHVSVGGISASFCFLPFDDVNNRGKMVQIPYGTYTLEPIFEYTDNVNSNIDFVTIKGFIFKDNSGNTYLFDVEEKVYSTAHTIIEKGAISSETKLHHIGPRDWVKDPVTGGLTHYVRVEPPTNQQLHNWIIQNQEDAATESIVAWHISEIKDINNNEINFEYVLEEYRNPVRYIQEMYSASAYYNDPEYFANVVVGDVNTEMADLSKTVRPRITSIYTENSKADFVYINEKEDLWLNGLSAENAKELNRIEFSSKSFYSSQFEIINTIHFKYEYSNVKSSNCYSANGPENHQILKEVWFKSKDRPDAPYQFNYSFNSLYSKFSYNMDIWGYPKNGSPTSNIPEVYVYPSLSGKERFSVIPYHEFNLTTSDYDNHLVLDGEDMFSNNASDIDELEQIILPGGGYINISYEENEFIPRDEDPNKSIVGAGLRINKIENYLADNTLIAKQEIFYKNVQTGLKSGKLTIKPKYGYFDPVGPYGTSYQNWTEYYRHNYIKSNTDYANYYNDPIVYNEVWVSQNDKGYYKYIFEESPIEGEAFSDPDYEESYVGIFENENSTSAYTGGDNFGYGEYPYPPQKNYNWKAGMLKQVYTLDNSYNELSSKEYDFSTQIMGQTQDLIKCLNVGYITNTKRSSVNDYETVLNTVAEYEMVYNIAYNLDESINTEKIANKQISSSSNFTYNNQNLPASTQSNANNIIKSLTYYNFDKYDPALFTYTAPASENTTYNMDDETIGLLTLIENNMITPLEELTLKKIGSSYYILGGIINTYHVNETGKPRLYQTYILEIDDPILWSEGMQLSGLTINSNNIQFVIDNRFKLQRTNDKYDDKGRLLEWHSENNIHHATIYGYNSRLPVASVVNGEYGESGSSDNGNFGYEGFEDENNFWLIQSGAASFDTIHYKTGERSLKLNPGYNDCLSGIFNPSDQEGAYIFNAWFYSGQSFSNPAVGLLIEMHNNGQSVSGSQITEYYPANENGWQFVQIRYDMGGLKDDLNISADVQLKCEVINNSASQTMYIDDLRLHEETAIMNTSTFNLFGLSSSSDNNNIPSYIEYDEAGKSSYTLDHNKLVRIYAESHIGDPCNLLILNNEDQTFRYVKNKAVSFAPVFSNIVESATISFGDNESVQFTQEEILPFLHTYSSSGPKTINVSITINGYSYTKQYSIYVNND